jgi:hypothetical protein
VRHKATHDGAAYLKYALNQACGIEANALLKEELVLAEEKV